MSSYQMTSFCPLDLSVFLQKGIKQQKALTKREQHLSADSEYNRK